MKLSIIVLAFCVVVFHSNASADAAINEAIEHGNTALLAQDYRLSAKMYSIAAHSGHPSGQMGLGFLYGAGWGVPQDLKQAYMWFHLAATNQSTRYGQEIIEIGRREGQASKDRLDQSMSRSDRDEALRQADRCLASGFEYCGGIPEQVIFSVRCVAAMFVANSHSQRIPLPNLRGHSSKYFLDTLMATLSPYDCEQSA